MKQILTFFACLLVSIAAMAEEPDVRLMKVVTNVGEQIFVVNHIEEVDFYMGKMDFHRGLERSHEYVNLGLSSKTLWATCNVGAKTSDDYGDYFAWGELEPKDVYDYDWSSDGQYIYGVYDKNDPNYGMTKYNKTDGEDRLLSDDDVANVKWGGIWRMPTQAQWNELFTEPRLEWKWIEGKGYEITSKIEGYEGAKLFLPAVGARGGASGVEGVNGYYWSSSNSVDNPFYAKLACIKNGTHDATSVARRCYGHAVRPVFVVP